MIASTWAEVEKRWDRAEAVFLGQKMPQFDHAVSWLSEHPDRLTDVRVVLWVGAEWSVPPPLEKRENISVWRGEIDAEQLMDWWQANPPALQHPNLDRQFLVVAAFPYAPADSVAEVVTAWADLRYGRHGGWVDLDWGGAALSLDWLSELYQRSDYPFEQLRIRRTRGGHQFVPAPPPWRPGTAGPQARDLRSLLSQGWDWQGWFLGSQIASPWALELVRSVHSILVWCGGQPKPAVIERIEQFLRVYQERIQMVIAVDASSGTAPGLTDRWPIWTLGSAQETSAGPRLWERWKLPRGKKG